MNLFDIISIVFLQIIQKLEFFPGQMCLFFHSSKISEHKNSYKTHIFLFQIISETSVCLLQWNILYKFYSMCKHIYLLKSINVTFFFLCKSLYQSVIRIVAINICLGMVKQKKRMKEY